MKEQLPKELLNQTIDVSCTFQFDSAHFLMNYPGPCAEMHGHTYKLEVVVGGKVDENGFVIDLIGEYGSCVKRLTLWESPTYSATFEPNY